MRSLLPFIISASRHAESETAGDLDGVLATMEGEPIYDFYPCGRRFCGMAETRRYYEHFIANVRPRIIDAEQHCEWIGEDGVIQEYTVLLQHAGEDSPTSHRIISVLTFGQEGLSGERMYSDDKFFKTLIGPLWDKLTPIPARGRSLK
jgi:hypothetical protein